MKKISKVLLSIFLFLIVCFVYYYHLSDIAQKGRLNKMNIKKISIGMDTIEVRRIMGIPEDFSKGNNKIYYHYDPGPGRESYACSVQFDSTGRVIGVFDEGE